MFELQQAGPQSYYINCPAKIGIYARSEREVYLIDSGKDKEAAKKVLKIADFKGWSIKGTLNTHSNADHIGGNAFIQNKTGCPVFCSGIDAAFTRHPAFEPSFLYGGYPCKNLRNKFLMAKESVVSDFSSPEFPKEVEIIPLPGRIYDTMMRMEQLSPEMVLAYKSISKNTARESGRRFYTDGSRKWRQQPLTRG